MVLVVGPSGAGKDTLIACVRERLADNRRFAFPRRIITRPNVPLPGGAEVHEEMSEAEFLLARDRGEFALSWQSHGLHYGIPMAVVREIAAGRVVVANVSRTVVPAAAEIVARRLVVNVTAPPDILAARLARRGRETRPEIASRVARAVELNLAGADFAEIRNTGSIEDGVGMLMTLLLRLVHFTPAPDAQRQ